MGYQSNRLCILKIFDGSSMGLSHDFMGKGGGLIYFLHIGRHKALDLLHTFYVLFYELGK